MRGVSSNNGEVMTVRTTAVAWSPVRSLARRGAFAAGLATVLWAAQAQAQFLFFEPPVSGREVGFLLRDRGVAASSRPRLFGDVYVVHGTNRRGERVRVIIDAFAGRVVETTVLLPRGVRLRDYDAGPRRARLREDFDSRPPALVPSPGERQEAMRPDEDDDGVDEAPRVAPTPNRTPDTRRSKPKRPATAARQPPADTPKPEVKAAPDVQAPAAAKPAEEKPPQTAARPPAASEPKADTPEKPASKPPATAARPPAAEPERRDVPKPVEKPPVTAARPPAVEPEKRDAPKPAEKPPVTAARPPAPSEPAKAEPSAVEKPASTTAATTGSSGPGAVKIVPPAPLDEAKARTKAPPPLPPVQPMD